MWWLLAACSGQPSLVAPEGEAPALAEVEAPVDGGAAARVDAEGVRLAATYQCDRCHEAPDRWASRPREQSCVSCHQAAYTDAFDGEYTADGIARWRRNIHSLRVVPSLVGVQRLREDWLRAYLSEPHDTRPNMPATMPRLALTDDEVDVLAAWLASDEAAEAVDVDGDVARGVQLMQERGCGGCHAFGGAGAWEAPAMGAFAEALSLAPDLAHARKRMTPATVDRWLVDPRSMKADTLMPAPVLTDDERRDVVAALFGMPLSPAEAAPFQPPPPLQRPVRYDEVKEQVFDVVCQHCHANPSEANQQDGGPGSTGGFGYAPADLVLSTWEGIHNGRLGADGERQSILDDDDPLIVAVLHARHREEEGHPGEVRGMPLGLEPLSAEQIQLVEAWVAQGAPR